MSAALEESRCGVKAAWLLRETGNLTLEAGYRIPPNIPKPYLNEPNFCLIVKQLFYNFS